MIFKVNMTSVNVNRYDLVDASTELWGSGTAKDPEFGTFFGRVIRKVVIIHPSYRFIHAE